ncbi:hypothetical protein GBA65_22130 (plasmid) [Rubrobacter marinus]|uniref:Uncharacterized protein n=1 Tax=Rubrobacter marinus TaxID=2653852 RepID=A0A6G8Q3Q8_9ACTN|nr:hypothetical protein [Rubrobacter marinus]QIN81134.1 hypothetical protein GBA65_22130 [Rubrobacter marinus]
METGHAPHGDPALAADDREEAAGCLLDAHDAMLERTQLDGEALQAWFDFEEAAFRYGLNPDLSREELEAAAEAVGCCTPSCPRVCRAAPTAAEAA